MNSLRIFKDIEKEHFLNLDITILGLPHGQRNLAGHSPWSHIESGMTKAI